MDHVNKAKLDRFTCTECARMNGQEVIIGVPPANSCTNTEHGCRCEVRRKTIEEMRRK